MSSPIAECQTCGGRVFRCTAGADEIAECADCKAVWGSFRVGPGQPVTAPVEFTDAR